MARGDLACNPDPAGTAIAPLFAMRTIIRFGIGLCLTVGLSFAVDMFRGQLVDASCYNQNPSKTDGKIWVRCAPKETTTTFAIHADGKIRMLDAAGNEKVQAAFKQGILKRDPNGDMPVVIDGSLQGNTIRVEGIRARGSDTSVH
jgi:hypothetical protein